MRSFKYLLFVIAAVATMNLGSVRADQVHMKRALEHLRAARDELQRAEHDKGGWRQRAIRNVDQAIADTGNGIRAAR